MTSQNGRSTGELRVALVNDQKIEVEPADAARIAGMAETVTAVLDSKLTYSLFDTEPAHYERLVRGFEPAKRS